MGLSMVHHNELYSVSYVKPPNPQPRQRPKSAKRASEPRPRQTAFDDCAEVGMEVFNGQPKEALVACSYRVEKPVHTSPILKLGLGFGAASGV